MTATTSTTASTGLSALKGLLLIVTGAGAGFLACWYATVEPTRAEVARLESGTRSLQDERDAERAKVGELEAASELQRTSTTTAAKERETLLADLQTARANEATLKKELTECQDVVRAKVEALAKGRLDLESAEQRIAQMASERDEAVQAMQASAQPDPIQLAPIESSWNGSPSALAKRAQSVDVREALSPLLAKGLHQPFRQPTGEPMPFSLRAIEDAGALDRSNPESLYSLWSIVTARENDRADKWPTAWAPLDVPGWLEMWFEARGDDAIPALDRAQRFLIELGPTLVELRMLAP